MAVVHQTDNRTGITYAYESISVWDKEKKQSRSKRRLIGRVDKDTGEIVETDGRMRRKKTPKPPAAKNRMSNNRRLFFGATYLLDAIGDRIGLTEDLKKCFPDMYPHFR